MAEKLVSHSEIASHYNIAVQTVQRYGREERIEGLVRKDPYALYERQAAFASVKRCIKTDKRRKVSDREVAKILDLVKTHTQAQVARRFGLTPGYVSQLANGKRRVAK